MTDTTHKDDIDTTALFAEIEKEKLGDYETCSASETFDAAFQCYSKCVGIESALQKDSLFFY